MRHAHAAMIALAGTACLGSIASMAVPTRMVMAEQQAHVGSRADRNFTDAPAYYAEPGPEDLVPASYSISSEIGPAWQDLHDAVAYHSDWLDRAAERDWRDASRAAADGDVPDPADIDDASAMAPEAPASAVVDAAPELDEMQDTKSPTPALQVAGSGPDTARAPQKIAVIEVPAPQ